MTVKELRERLESLNDDLDVGTMFWESDADELEVFRIKEIREVDIIAYDEVDEEADYREESIVVIVAKMPVNEVE